MIDHQPTEAWGHWEETATTSASTPALCVLPVGEAAATRASSRLPDPIRAAGSNPVSATTDEIVATMPPDADRLHLFVDEDEFRGSLAENPDM
jgi:hypothetical protein